MLSPSSSTVTKVVLLQSSTGDRGKRNESRIVSAAQKPAPLQDASNKANTKRVLLVTKSEKNQHGTFLGYKKKAGMGEIKITTSLETLKTDSSSLLTKRKRKKALLLDNPSTEILETTVSVPSSPDDISLLSASFRSNETKRPRQLSALLWTLPSIEEINTEFSRPETILPRPRRSLCENEPRRSLRSQTTISGDSGQSQSLKEEARETLCSIQNQISSCSFEGTSQEGYEAPLSSSELKDILSSGYTKEVNVIPKSLLKIIPLGFFQHLQENNKRCLAWTTQGQRCRISHATTLPSAQLQALVSVETSALLPRIQQLVDAALCSTHRRVASKEIQTWKEEFQEFLKMQSYKTTVSLRKEQSRAIARWIHLLGQAARLQASQCPAILSVTSTTIMPTEAAPINPIQEFKSYVSKASTETLSEELSKLLTKPLQRSDIKYQGSIYIFWQTPNFGHLKIGRSGNIHRRLNEWNKQCKKEMRIHFPDFAGDQNKSLSDMQHVPHISRVEALVHLELKHHRKIEERCPGCYKSHTEWFEVSKETAVKVVRKWTSWMATLPYEKHMKDGKEQWLLKIKEFKHLDKLCQPTEEFHPPSRPLKERKSPSRPRHSLPNTGREERARFFGL